MERKVQSVLGSVYVNQVEKSLDVIVILDMYKSFAQNVTPTTSVIQKQANV